MLADLSVLVQQCAPNVGAVTMRAIIKTESGGNPYILADAGPASLPWSQRESMVRTLRPASAQEAAAAVHDLVRQGHIVAIGLAQINYKNLAGLGLTVEQVLDPCTNIRAGAKVLSDFYARALRKLGPSDPQAALQAALSSYWSGNMVDGFRGGYVQKVINNAGLAVELKVPSLAQGAVLRTPRGMYAVGRNGTISPYTAPLQADFGPKLRARSTSTIAAVDPRRAPLEAVGFRSDLGPTPSAYQ